MNTPPPKQASWVDWCLWMSLRCHVNVWPHSVPAITQQYWVTPPVTPKGIQQILKIDGWIILGYKIIFTLK